MAKIIFSTISNVAYLNKNAIDAYYEGFIRSLKRNGNDILLVIGNDYLYNIFENREKNFVKPDKIKRIIEDFEPDIVFTFNNILPETIRKYIECPIAVWSADSPEYFADKEIIKKEVDRYHFIHFTETMEKLTSNYFGNSKNFTIGHATDLNKLDINQDKNISFVGSSLICQLEEIRNLFSTLNKKEKQEVTELLNKLVSDPLRNLLLLEDDKLNNKLDYIKLLTANERIQVLNSLVDLGLNIFGYTKDWPSNLINFSYKLFLSYQSDVEVYSISHLEHIYNSSKISINLNNHQAEEGLSWRVCDVMSSNSCLVSTPKKDLIKYFKPYLDIPTYESPAEAYDICKKLLQDEKWRKDLVLKSQIAIDENCRFEHRMRDLEQIFGINLFCNKEGSIKKLHDNSLIEMSETNTHMSCTNSQKSFLNLSNNFSNILVKLVIKSYHTLPDSLKIKLVSIIKIAELEYRKKDTKRGKK